MRYIKLKCEQYDCKAEFLIELNDWYNKEYEEIVQDFYICPICNSLVHSNKEDCIIEIKSL